MKKILLGFVAFFVISSFSATAVEFQGGLKLGHGTLDATETSAVNNQKGSDDASSAFGAIFLEAVLDSGLPINLVAGIEYIPYEGVIDIAPTDGGDYEGTLKNHTTLYLQGSKTVGPVDVFGKIGYVTVDISNVKSSTHTLTSTDDSASGYTVGLGVQKNLSGLIDFVRVGVDYIDYGSVEATASSGTYKADADAIAAYISVGKKF
jgi:opacity protein-like surface antigen